MGGKGSGGRRANAGRPRKDVAARALDGNANHRGRVLAHPSAASVPTPDVIVPSNGKPAYPVVDEEHAPNDLSIDERHVWLELAPKALANGTLTEEAELDFRRLCKHLVLERRYMQSVLDAGTANHRGMIQKVDLALTRFGLAGTGRPAHATHAAQAIDPIKEKYFGSGRLGA